MVKTCRDCGEEKDLSQFYKHKQMRDGHLNKCKDCVKGRVAIHRIANIESIRGYDRRRGRSTARIKKNTEYNKKYRKLFPKKYTAKNKVNNAVRDGRLTKPIICEVCNLPCRQIEGHHNDYSKPLDVSWLCSACHSQLHINLSNSKEA